MGFIDGFLETMGLNGDDYEDEMDYIEEEEKPRVTKKSSKRKASYEDDYEDEPEEVSFNKTYTNRFMDNSRSQKAKPQPVASRSNSKLVPLTSSKSAGEIYVLKPINDRDCWDIIDCLKEGKAIILNLDGMKIDDAQHIIDIVAGCCYTIDGAIERISPSIFVAAPADMEINIREDLLNEVLGSEGVTLDLRNNF